MQKLQGKFKNVPRNASLVPCSTSSVLNKGDSLSVQNNGIFESNQKFHKRTCNNTEGNPRKHEPGSVLRVLNVVYVLNKRGLSLMPTCRSTARRLLNSGKAVIVRRYPFTIQLTCVVGETKQKTYVGVDTPYEFMGISVFTDKKVLFASETKLRTDITERLSERRMYRRGRRSRHHWYREPRFDNRKRKDGWLPPSMQQKVDSISKMVNYVSKFLPIDKTNITAKVFVETAKFDIQKIMNPEITKEEYRNGVQKDSYNAREYVLHRDEHTCQYCKKQEKELILVVHHIESRKTGGNRPDNLITLCVKCHEKLHKGKIKLNIKPKDNYKSETCMSIIRKVIIKELKKNFLVEETFGYITKERRIERGIEKSHINDAFVIANGNKQKQCDPYYVEQKRKNNRCLQLNRKGFAPSIRRQRYNLQPKDRVIIKSVEYKVKGIHSRGKYVKVLDKNGKEFNFKCSLVEKCFHVGSFVWK